MEEIKNRLDLVEIIRGYMKLEKAGINFRGLCPFHREKTPSFFVSPTRQLWKCFGCGVGGGDMFTFIQQIEGVDFKEALGQLAAKAGVQLRSYDPKTRSEKSRLYEICERACQFFEKQLSATELGREAREYLLKRGLKEAIIEYFRLGFAPYSREGLTAFLRNQGYSPSEIFKAGVASQGSGGSYDRFRGRIMFPIFDANGQVIAFGGRVFFAKNQVEDPKLAKYINTSQTMLYDKSRVLYGLDKAKMKIREKDYCLLVEGYMDTIMAHQAGADNAVATSGTALTEGQLDLLRRYTENLVTCFDMDIAGNNATKRGIDIAQRKGFNIRVIVLPEGKDPAELVQKDQKKWQKALEQPFSIGDFYFQSTFARFEKHSPDGMRNISQIILPMIKRIPSQIERSYWVQKLAAEFGCGENLVWSDLAKISSSSSTEQYSPKVEGLNEASKIPSKKTKEELLCDQMLFLAFKDPTCAKILSAKDAALLPQGSVAATLVTKLRKHKRPEEFFLHLSGEDKKYSDSILFSEEIFPTFEEGTDFQEEFKVCVQSLKCSRLKERLTQIQREMKAGNRTEELLQEFQTLSMELAKLS